MVRSFLYLALGLALPVFIGACDGERCAGFDPQGRCIPAEKDTTGEVTGTGAVVNSGTISVLLTTITADTIKIDPSGEFNRGCGPLAAVYYLRVRGVDAAMDVSAGSPFGLFLADARAKIGVEPTIIEVTDVKLRLDPAGGAIAGFEDIFSDAKVTLIGQDIVVTVGEGKLMTGSAATLGLVDTTDDVQRRYWIDNFLTGAYTVQLDATTESAEYSVNCGSCPPDCTCDCTEIPDEFEMNVIVDLQFRAQ